MSETDTKPEAIAASMGDLKPCPFCGSKDIGWSWVNTYSIDSSYATFGCMNCGVSFTADEDNTMHPDDVAAWNRRATPPEVTALVEAATSMRDQIARWHAGGPVAGPEESRALFEALDEALAKWEAANA